MPGVAEFVDHQVAQQARLEEQQAVIDADGPTRRMAAPTGALAAHVHALEAVAGQRREFPQPRFELLV